MNIKFIYVLIVCLWSYDKISLELESETEIQSNNKGKNIKNLDIKSSEMEKINPEELRSDFENLKKFDFNFYLKSQCIHKRFINFINDILNKNLSNDSEKFTNIKNVAFLWIKNCKSKKYSDYLSLDMIENMIDKNLFSYVDYKNLLDILHVECDEFKYKLMNLLFSKMLNKFKYYPNKEDLIKELSSNIYNGSVSDRLSNSLFYKKYNYFVNKIPEIFIFDETYKLKNIFKAYIGHIKEIKYNNSVIIDFIEKVFYNNNIFKNEDINLYLNKFAKNIISYYYSLNKLDELDDVYYKIFTFKEQIKFNFKKSDFISNNLDKFFYLYPQYYEEFLIRLNENFENLMDNLVFITNHEDVEKSKFNKILFYNLIKDIENSVYNYLINHDDFKDIENKEKITKDLLVDIKFYYNIIGDHLTMEMIKDLLQIDSNDQFRLKIIDLQMHKLFNENVYTDIVYDKKNIKKNISNKMLFLVENNNFNEKINKLYKYLDKHELDLLDNLIVPIINYCHYHEISYSSILKNNKYLNNDILISSDLAEKSFLKLNNIEYNPKVNDSYFIKIIIPVLANLISISFEDIDCIIKIEDIIYNKIEEIEMDDRLKNFLYEYENLNLLKDYLVPKINIIYYNNC